MLSLSFLRHCSMHWQPVTSSAALGGRVSQHVGPSPLLRDEIDVLVKSLSASPDQYDRLDRVVSYFRSVLEPKFSGSKIIPFGSCSNGLWGHGSDVDVTVIIPKCNSKQKVVSKLRAARSFLRRGCSLMGESVLTKEPEVTVEPDTFIVENARYPVLQLTANGLHVDCSVNNLQGVENSMLVKTWCNLDPRFAPLARSVKYWAKMKNVNERARGTLSTYTIILMLVYFLQNRPMGAILPLFSQFSKPHILAIPFEEKNGLIRELPFHTTFNWKSKNSEPIELLFFEFFEFWGNEQLGNGVDVTNDLMTFPPTGILSMHCPLVGNDVNVMSSSVWAKIHKEFVQARNMLRSGASLTELVR